MSSRRSEHTILKRNDSSSSASSSENVKLDVAVLSPKSSFVSTKKATPPLSVDVSVTPRRELPQLVTPSPDSGCSSVSSKQLQSDHQPSNSTEHVFAIPELPRRRLNRPDPVKIDVKSTGTSIYLPTQSTLAKMKSPVRKSPTRRTPSRRSSSETSRDASKSPSRRRLPPPPSPVMFAHEDHVFDNASKDVILNSKTNGDMHPDFGRPSIAKIQGTGVVNRRIQQFKNLSITNPSFFQSSAVSLFYQLLVYCDIVSFYYICFNFQSDADRSSNSSSAFKPRAPPAAHGLVWNRTTTQNNGSETSCKSFHSHLV